MYLCVPELKQVVARSCLETNMQSAEAASPFFSLTCNQLKESLNERDGEYPRDTDLQELCLAAKKALCSTSNVTNWQPVALREFYVHIDRNNQVHIDDVMAADP